MTVAEMFSALLANLQIENIATISDRYGELTSALNKRFRDTESKSANVLQVGSFGRKTGINGISDLDMLYILPFGLWEDYRDNGQARLLRHAREAISNRYPNTEVRVDRLVVTVTYLDFHVEVQPVFEMDDRSYKYPDTIGDGSWKITKPREEIAAIDALDQSKNYNLKCLCKMVRAWKNKHGLEMGGLLVDTLAYNFLSQTTDYDETSYSTFHYLCRDFFQYLVEQPDQAFYLALGSGQQVKVRTKFQRKAKKALRLVDAAIEAEETHGAHDKWKKVFGRPFPARADVRKASVNEASKSWSDTEEFIEDRYPIDVRYALKIDCEVKQRGYLEHTLREMLARRIPLLANKQLHFKVTSCNVPQPFELMWKVLNRGEVAQRRNCIRGQIVGDQGKWQRTESTNFRGDHVVECFAVKNGVVVAKDRIHVPINTNDEQE